MKIRRDVASQIESKIRRSDWSGARRLIQAQLRRSPDHHWLLARLSLTYYEQYDYRRALLISNKAFKLMPRCPLVVWDHAGALAALGYKQKAIAIYRRLVGRGARSIATGECGEGLARARGLVADSYYRLGECYAAIGRPKQAAHALKQALAMRGPGCHSIYPLAEVRRTATEIRQARHVA
jgi:tetratricopeptide (TPR) repeat protein